MKVVIYGLSGPDGVIKYIGQTRQPLKRRLHRHDDRASGPNDWPISVWIRETGLQSIKIEPLEECEHEDRLICEREWILKLKTSVLHGGCNTWVGGQMPPDTLKKMQANLAAAKTSPNYRPAGQKRGFQHSAETRARMSVAHKEAHARWWASQLARIAAEQENA